MLPSHRAHASSIALLLSTVAACGSFGANDGEPPPTPAGSDGGPSDAGTAPTDADVSGGPCRGAPHDLCHDFEDGSKEGGGWSLSLGGGSAQLTPTTSLADRGSLELTASSDGPRLTGPLAPSTSFSCSFRVQPVDVMGPSGAFASLFEARSNGGGRGIELRLLPGGSLDAYAVGPNSTFQKLDVTGMVPPGAWTRITLSVSPDGTGGGRFDVRVGEGQNTQTGIKNGSYQPDGYTAVKIGLGLNKTVPSAWKLVIDDLICDVRP